MMKKSASAQPDPSPVQGLHVAERDGWLWVTLPDAINMDNHQRIECRIESLLVDGCRVAIDLAETKNMYSSGFGMVVRLKKRIDERGGAVFLVNTSPRTMEALRGVGLTKLMRVYPEGARLDFLEG